VRALVVVAVFALAQPLVADPGASPAPRLLWSDVHGPHGNARSIVFVSDGYTESDRARYEKKCHALVSEVLFDDASRGSRHPEEFNFHCVWVPSNENGSAKPGDARDTAFHMHLPKDDDLVVADDARADAAAVAAAPDVDVVVIVGYLKHGVFSPSRCRPCADIPPLGARVRLPDDYSDGLVHELGHAIYGLGDEYVDHGWEKKTVDPEDVAPFPNLTADPSGERFKPYVPGPYVPGGARVGRGVWHATTHCRMGNDCYKKNAPFCPVCRAAIDGRPATKPRAPSVSLSGETALFKAGGDTFELVVDVVRTDGGERKVLDDREIEGETPSLSLQAVSDDGTYRLEVKASNPAGVSEVTSVTFTRTNGLVSVLPDR
jgi:hypothetical protein